MTTTITKHLLEAATLIGESASEDGTWKIKVISEGKGSSGIYTAELLEGHHSAFDDVLSFKNHPTGWDGPESRDFTMIAGEISGATWVDVDETGRKAIYANYLPDPEFKDKLERYKDKLGLSIYIEGSGYENEAGEFVVDWFNPADPYASLDVVIAPGARGKFLESARKAYESVTPDPKKSTVTSAEEEKEIKLDEKDREKLDALVTAVASLVADKEEATAEAAQATADANAGRDAVEAYDAAVSAIDAAELPEKVVESLRKQAKEGVDVAPLIEQATAMKEALATSLQESAASGRDFGSKTETKFGAFK